MTKLIGPLFSLQAVKTLAKAITFQTRGSHTRVIKKPIPSNPNTPAQRQWRHMYSKAAALWHSLSLTEQQVWNSLASKRHMTGFSYFMSQCLRPNPGIYLPLQGGTMQGDIIMAKHNLLQLPLPSDSQEAAPKGYVDSAITDSLSHPNARVYRDANLAIDDEEQEAFPFNTELWDNGDLWEPAPTPGVLKAPSAGLYVISATFVFAADPAGYRGLTFLLSPATFIADIKVPACAVGYTALTLYTQYHLNADDKIEVCPYHNVPPNLTILAIPNQSPHFMMSRIST